MVANVGRPMRRMDRKIHRRPVAVGQILREGPRQLQSLFGRKLVRQGDLEFARDARVLALVRLLGRVPQGRTILRPFGVRALRNDDLGVFDALAPGEVVRQPVAFVRELLGRPIGRRRHRAAPRGPRDRLHGEVIDRQTNSIRINFRTT